MQLLATRAAAAVLQRKCSGCVVEDLDRESAVRRLARGRVDAHVRHVARDHDRVDACILEHAPERGVRERAGQRLVHRVVLLHHAGAEGHGQAGRGEHSEDAPDLVVDGALLWGEGEPVGGAAAAALAAVTALFLMLRRRRQQPALAH